MNSSSKPQPTSRKRRRPWPHLLFAAGCCVVLIVLLRAPEETTTPLPDDQVHAPFHLIASKKEADRSCVACHAPGKESPLPEDHPPPFRCLFCHKRD